MANNKLHEALRPPIPAARREKPSGELQPLLERAQNLAIGSGIIAAEPHHWRTDTLFAKIDFSGQITECLIENGRLLLETDSHSYPKVTLHISCETVKAKNVIPLFDTIVFDTCLETLVGEQSFRVTTRLYQAFSPGQKEPKSSNFYLIGAKVHNGKPVGIAEVGVVRFENNFYIVHAPQFGPQTIIYANQRLTHNHLPNYLGDFDPQYLASLETANPEHILRLIRRITESGTKPTNESDFWTFFSHLPR